ncbi:MAG: hypothetical protein WBH39_05650 [Candidatus Microthrix parvicella]
MTRLWKWPMWIAAGIGAVFLGVGLGIGLSRTLGHDQDRAETIGGNEADIPSERAGDSTPRMTERSLGPIELGMPRQKALATGWLGDSQTHCSDIIGDEGSAPGEYNYKLGGDDLPDSLAGHVEFVDDRVSLIQVDSDVELPDGLSFNSSWDNPTAERAFVDRGYSFEPDGIFDPNDSATARSASGEEFGMYFSAATQDAFVAIPQVVICD